MYIIYTINMTHITVVTSDMSEQHAIFEQVHIVFHLEKCGEI